MVDWTQSMEQSFEYYIVDPGTWKDQKLLDTAITSTINRDGDADTLGSASIDITGALGECYVRIYLITIQNGIRDKHPLGTFLIQTPTSNFDGMVKTTSIDAYTPLLELKEGLPPLGYSIIKGANIMDTAYSLCREKMRAPVIQTSSSKTLYDDFVSNTDDNWLTFNKDLIANANHEFALDELGRILFLPKQDAASLQPVQTFDDGNSSILYPDVSIEQDLYGIPNVVEVLYSNGSRSHYYKVVNDDPASPVSTVSRGREILYRDTEPSLVGDPTENQIKAYAEQLLRNLSSMEYTVTYTHGYCPVRLGDCVLLNYPDAGLNNVKAKVISQSIKCEPGCPVTEKAVFTIRLWE